MVTMLHKNLDTLNGDSNTPEWIVRNVVIDLAGYDLIYWAKSAVIDDDEMTYTISYRDNPDDPSTKIITDTLSYQDIWRTMNSIARTGRTTYNINKDSLDAIRMAVFDKDGGDIDSPIAGEIIQVALFGKVLFG